MKDSLPDILTLSSTTNLSLPLESCKRTRPGLPDNDEPPRNNKSPPLVPAPPVIVTLPPTLAPEDLPPEIITDPPSEPPFADPPFTKTEPPIPLLLVDLPPFKSKAAPIDEALLPGPISMFP